MNSRSGAHIFYRRDPLYGEFYATKRGSEVDNGEGTVMVGCGYDLVRDQKHNNASWLI